MINGAIPLLGYGWSKTSWVGIDLAIHPPEPHEEADAMTAAEAVRREPSGEELDPRPPTAEDGGWTATQ